MYAVSQSSLLLMIKVSMYAADFLKKAHGSKNTSKGDKEPNLELSSLQ